MYSCDILHQTTLPFHMLLKEMKKGDDIFYTVYDGYKHNNLQYYLVSIKVRFFEIIISPIQHLVPMYVYYDL